MLYWRVSDTSTATLQLFAGASRSRRSRRRNRRLRWMICCHEARHRTSSYERSQDFTAAGDFFIRGGVADAEVSVALAEDVAGDNKHVVFDGLGDEFTGRCAGGGLGENVEGALGLHDLKPGRKARDDQIAVSAVRYHGISHRHVQRLECRILQRGWGAHERILLKLGHLRDDRLGPRRVAQPPASHGVAFGEAAKDDRLLVNAGGGGEGSGRRRCK